MHTTVQPTMPLPAHLTVLAFANGERVEIPKLESAIRLTELTIAREDPMRAALEAAKQRVPGYRRREVAVAAALTNASEEQRASIERLVAFDDGVLEASATSSILTEDITWVKPLDGGFGWEVFLADVRYKLGVRIEEEVRAERRRTHQTAIAAKAVRQETFREQRRRKSAPEQAATKKKGGGKLKNDDRRGKDRSRGHRDRDDN